MPTVYIDNEPFEFEPGAKVLQFCLDMGLVLPHFCYHPAMSIPANCRQCLVKAGMPAKNRETGQVETDDNGDPIINFFPKLQTSCSLDLADGMVVLTQRTSEEVAGAQEDNLEFLLINHPLDCPICDQAGHCPLQNQAYKFGPEGSRFEFEKVHKPKRVQLGPRVTLDAERCINCTRCTRFTEEISGSNQLTIINRGVTNFPTTPPGTTFDEPYSMNVIDICPVGALTSTDFRFKARVWETSQTASISVHSSKGVNVDYWVRDNLIVQIVPRQNQAVNKYWMADEDRLDYRRFNDDRPQNGPEVRSGDGSLVPAEWTDAIEAVAALLSETGKGKLLFLGSAHATVEDNYLLMRLAELTGNAAPVFLSHVVEGSGDGQLVTDDKAPNAAGCRALGMAEVSPAELKSHVAKADVVYVLEDDPVAAGAISTDDLAGKAVVLHYHRTTNHLLTHARVALPAAMAVETVGTMVNVDGIAQRLRPAKAIRSVNRSLVMEMGTSRPDRHGTPFDRWYNESHKIDCRPSWDLLQEIAEKAGLDLRFKSPSAIMNDIAGKVAAFDSVTYDTMGFGGARLTTDVSTGAS
ncbi:MAG TPA: 2Fe-2S iron-sulfur cluster-binding protein [Rhodothermales bacterium]|nr:2Fe-2S iron-sulfur cluster-binding protein [Rhodothermales bacterium]